MKQIQFETSKGIFILVELPIDVVSIKYGENGIWIKYEGDKKWNPFMDVENKVLLINALKQITEEQAIDIVGLKINLLINHKNYLIEMLKLKSIHLFKNPYPIGTSEEDYILFKQAEQKTFYNPYIFKL